MDRIIHIIITGKTLISNDGGRGCLRRSVDAVIELNEIIRNTFCEELSREITDVLLKLDPEEEISYRGNQRTTCRDRLPKEISYLFIMKNRTNNAKKESVYLISADDTASKTCTEVIKQYIDRNPQLNNCYSVCDIKIISGINPYNGTEFQQKGIKNLIHTVSDIIEINKDATIYINMTDESYYTSAVPYITQLALQYDNVVLCCLHGNSSDIIEFRKTL